MIDTVELSRQKGTWRSVLDSYIEDNRKLNEALDALERKGIKAGVSRTAPEDVAANIAALEYMARQEEENNNE